MIDYDEVTPTWEDNHRYGPAPRWRRRMLQSILRRLNVSSILDAGCAQPFLLLSLQKENIGAKFAGCDYSRPVIEKNKQLYPDIDFFECNLSDIEIAGQNGKKFDCVVCSEVLEHVPDYSTAISNLCRLSGKYVVVTVPAGKIQATDKGWGHLRHFTKEMLIKEFENNKFDIKYITYKGFPFFSLYKVLINTGNGTKIVKENNESKWGLPLKMFANFVYFLFWFNIIPLGPQLVCVSRKRDV